VSSVSVVARVIALTIILFICYSVAGTVLQIGSAETAPAGASTALSLLLVCVLQTVVLSHLILRSRWSGWRLIAAVCLIFYGVATFMSQIESMVFLTHLPAGMLPRLFLMGIIVAAPFSVLAVILLGKRKTKSQDSEPNSRLVMPAAEWTWKIGVIGVVYVMFYFTFGYFVAWQNPAVREYYGGAEGGTFFTQLGNVLRDTPWLVPFQFVRALCWILIALPVIKMLKGSWQETALSLGFLFGVVMTAPLLLPNPFMPDAVRMAHLLEITPSNFIFGVLIGWLLAAHRSFAPIGITQGANP
jgi:hypothetical protein